MVKQRAPILSFNGGELSRRMEGRSDLDGIYDRAVAKMLNFVPTVEGPAVKRPGFRAIELEDPTTAWISKFVFNVTQAYLLAWLDDGLGGGKVRFYTNGGRVDLAPGVPYELAVPYPAAIAKELSVKQSYDRLYIAHPLHPPAMITRTSATTFTFETIPLKNGPFQDVNSNKLNTITWSGAPEVDGLATIVAVADIFDAGMVGSPFMFEVDGFSQIAAWEPQMKIDSDVLSVGTKMRSDGKVYQCDSLTTNAGHSSDVTGTIEPTHTSGSEWDGSQMIAAGTDNNYEGARWKYLYDRFGAGVITGFTDSKTVTIKVTRHLPDLFTPTYKWQLPWISDFAGWPQLIDVWAQRLILWKGVELAGSVTGSYFDYAPLDENGVFAPDQAFRQRLDMADPPMWTHADKSYLLVGTASREMTVGQINNAAGVSGDNIRADRQSSYGSAAGVWPLEIATGLIFLQRGGRKIREAAFDYSQDRFVGANVNIYARHVTRSGIVAMAFHQEPEEMLWGVRGDGTLIAHPHSPEQQVKGFARLELADGTALCASAIPSEDGSKDELWILADLAGARFILQLADWWDEDAGLDKADAFFVDYGVSYDGAPIDSFTTGLEHLEGRQVRILADGIVIDDLTVTGGALTLPKPASKVHIGLGYQARLKLLQPEARGGTSSMRGLRQRMIRLIARLVEAGSLVFVDAKGRNDRFFDRQNTIPMNNPPPGLFNGSTDDKSVGDGSSYDVAGELLNDDPLPCMITQLFPTYEVEEFR
jgi:hypothetical protein